VPAVLNGLRRTMRRVDVARMTGAQLAFRLVGLVANSAPRVWGRCSLSHKREFKCVRDPADDFAVIVDLKALVRVHVLPRLRLHRRRAAFSNTRLMTR
jgi:hypothetical protein